MAVQVSGAAGIPVHHSSSSDSSSGKTNSDREGAPATPSGLLSRNVNAAENGEITPPGKRILARRDPPPPNNPPQSSPPAPARNYRTLHIAAAHTGEGAAAQSPLASPTAPLPSSGRQLGGAMLTPGSSPTSATPSPGRQLGGMRVVPAPSPTAGQPSGGRAIPTLNLAGASKCSTQNKLIATAAAIVVVAGVILLVGWQKLGWFE